jgi:hypothetical protein
VEAVATGALEEENTSMEDDEDRESAHTNRVRGDLAAGARVTVSCCVLVCRLTRPSRSVATIASLSSSYCNNNSCHSSGPSPRPTSMGYS